jgi:hypothetical protein
MRSSRREPAGILLGGVFVLPTLGMYFNGSTLSDARITARDGRSFTAARSPYFSLSTHGVSSCGRHRRAGDACRAGFTARGARSRAAPPSRSRSLLPRPFFLLLAVRETRKAELGRESGPELLEVLGAAWFGSATVA